MIWPAEELNRLLVDLCHAARLSALVPKLAAPPSTLSQAQLSEWVMTSARLLAVDAEPVRLDGSLLMDQLRNGGPAIIQVADGFLGLLSCNGKVKLLVPSGNTVNIPLEELRDIIAAPAEQPLRHEISQLLERCKVAPGRQVQAQKELLRRRLTNKNMGYLWQLQTPPGSNFNSQLSEVALPFTLATFLAAHAMEYSLWITSWYLIGRSALAGQVDINTLTLSGLLLLTTVPFRMGKVWIQGQIAISLGGLLKQRLLAGALNLDPGDMRKQGAGQLLGQTIESDRVEALALSGGLNALLSLVDLCIVLWILGSGASGLFFLLWIGGTCWLAIQYKNVRSSWTDARLQMTHELVETMTGHRTRVAQQAPQNWHTTEDQQLENYLSISARLDRRKLWLTVIAPRTWLFAGLAAALYTTDKTPTSIAITLAGVLAGHQALRRLAQGLAQLMSANISWQQVKPMFNAAANIEPNGTSDEFHGQPSKTIMDANDLSFTHATGRTVVDKINLRIEEGDSILLEGESGSGKSTLISLLCGLRKSSRGQLKSLGLNQSELGILRWRKRIACAPQYHENHMLSAPLLFNLLMGRTWPPTREDTAEAQAICDELGLGPLIAAMPGGLSQMVGETGWQLSQGERSRVFLARALLQGGDLVVLDESLAALDPETMQMALACALRRAKTLLVVAHP